MNKNIGRGLLLFAFIWVTFSFITAHGDDGKGASLQDVHDVLMKAAGYQSDTPPTVAQQTELLHKALDMIEHIPHVYHGQLKSATQSINSALDDLAQGDAAHAKTAIYDADDQIKSIM